MSRKPEFFSYNMPLYEVVTPDGLMRPVLAAKLGGLYCGGSARKVWIVMLDTAPSTPAAAIWAGVCATAVEVYCGIRITQAHNLAP